MKKAHPALNLLVYAALAGCGGPSPSLQVADPAYVPPPVAPAFPMGRGPTVLVDEAHFNFHTAGERYRAFAELLRSDGYVVKPSNRKFTREALGGARLLVIANALAERNGSGNWTLPTPSAFSDEEIAAVKQWVEGGGSLLLIADHMPFPGAAEKLAAAFDVTLNNGFAVTPDPARMGDPFVFRRADGSLADDTVTQGSAGGSVDSVVTFTGSAFRAGPSAKPLLVLGPGTVSLMPDTAWRFQAATPRLPVDGWYQGAAIPVGKGRVAVFGEAAMFTAQVAPNGERFGMNAPAASGNAPFLLNVVHWLTAVD
jgi:hypothetical protein